MDCILYSAWQKFYNALSALNSISAHDSIFDNIKYIDDFFSEYRSTTLVMQKSFKNAGCIHVYEKYSKKYFTKKETWLVDARNDVIHKHPFKLEKKIVVHQYSALGKREISDASLTITHDKAFADLEDVLRELLDNAINDSLIQPYIDIYLGIELIFFENGTPVDVYSKILDGLSVMYNFMVDVSNEIGCGCRICSELKTKAEKLMQSAVMKRFSFVFDYQYNRNKKVWVSSMRMEAFVGQKNQQIQEERKMRIAVSESPVYKQFNDNGTINIVDMFRYFTMSLSLICRMQEKDIMPTFLVLFADKTFTQHTFVSSTKTTFYREISNVADILTANKVLAVFYAGIFYVHTDIDGFYSKSYEERAKSATKEILKTTMLSSKLYEIEFGFDVNKIDDDEYCALILNNVSRTSFKRGMFFPLKEKFILTTNKPYTEAARRQMIQDLI